MRFPYLRLSNQVFVEYRDDVTPTSPLEERTYTMTHSDTTGDLYVTIGLNYAKDKVNEIQDQVYLSWVPLKDSYFLYGEVVVDDPMGQGNTSKRNDIFKREMPLALKAIYTADLPLFEDSPALKETPVLIKFQSSSPEYNKLYNYGKIGDYQ